MKRFTLSVVITALLGLTAYSLADAQSAWRGFHDRQDGSGTIAQERRGPMGPGRGFGRGGPLLALRGLDLTEEQRNQIRAIREAEREGRQGPTAEAQLHRDLQAALFADAPDAGRIAELQQQLQRAQEERLAHRIAVEQKIAAVLTPEQRAQVRERLDRGRIAQ